MFILQKIISLSLFSPLPIILFLFFVGLSIIRKFKKRGILLIFTSIFLYLVSTNYFINPLLYSLEKTYTPITDTHLKEGEAYVLLGGGLTINTSGGTVPTVFADSRILTTAQLYQQYPKIIFISGGLPLQNAASESSIYKNELVKLGINQKDIIIEESSKTTFENAKYLKKELENNNIKSVILITSAFHMKRSVAIFKQIMPDITIYPASCNYLASGDNNRLVDFIPNYSNFTKFQFLIWELFGNIYYKIRY